MECPTDISSSRLPFNSAPGPDYSAHTHPAQHPCQILHLTGRPSSRTHSSQVILIHLMPPALFPWVRQSTKGSALTLPLGLKPHNLSKIPIGFTFTINPESNHYSPQWPKPLSKSSPSQPNSHRDASKPLNHTMTLLWSNLPVSSCLRVGAKTLMIAPYNLAPTPSLNSSPTLTFPSPYSSHTGLLAVP